MNKSPAFKILLKEENEAVVKMVLKHQSKNGFSCKLHIITVLGG